MARFCGDQAFAVPVSPCHKFVNAVGPIWVPHPLVRGCRVVLWPQGGGWGAPSEVGFSEVRDYVEKRGLRVTTAQLDLLVPAFDAAWAAVSKRGAFLLAGGEERVVKERLAKVVVDLVLNGQADDPHRIAET